jgi:uncharacterized membrane protein YeaQ/YmgE (transglycosylase-associated protein family)
MQTLYQILVSVLIGALVGWLAGKIMKSKNGFLFNAILGILGGALGGAGLVSALATNPAGWMIGAGAGLGGLLGLL